ncbi:hypothetical protein IFM47457_05560 [Aspergillus lentulus]|nr:hypothetical protein IFM47457_05560 [Aspergillus lentulus]
MVDKERLVVEGSSEAMPLLRNAAPIISAQECWQHKQLLQYSKVKGLFKADMSHGPSSSFPFGGLIYQPWARQGLNQVNYRKSRTGSMAHRHGQGMRCLH